MNVVPNTDNTQASMRETYEIINDQKEGDLGNNQEGNLGDNTVTTPQVFQDAPVVKQSCFAGLKSMTKSNWFHVALVIVGLLGLATAGVGAAGFFAHQGAFQHLHGVLGNLNQLGGIGKWGSIGMMAAGGAFSVAGLAGAIVLLKRVLAKLCAEKAQEPDPSNDDGTSSSEDDSSSDSENSAPSSPDISNNNTRSTLSPGGDVLESTQHPEEAKEQEKKTGLLGWIFNRQKSQDTQTKDTQVKTQEPQNGKSSSSNTNSSNNHQDDHAAYTTDSDESSSSGSNSSSGSDNEPSSLQKCLTPPPVPKRPSSEELKNSPAFTALRAELEKQKKLEEAVNKQSLTKPMFWPPFNLFGVNWGSSGSQVQASSMPPTSTVQVKTRPSPQPMPIPTNGNGKTRAPVMSSTNTMIGKQVQNPTTQPLDDSNFSRKLNNHGATGTPSNGTMKVRPANTAGTQPPVQKNKGKEKVDQTPPSSPERQRKTKKQVQPSSTVTTTQKQQTKYQGGAGIPGTASRRKGNWGGPNRDWPKKKDN